MAPPRAGTFPPMRALLERFRGLDPLGADALLAALFLIEAAVELAVVLPPHPPDVVVVALALVAMGAAITVRRRLPLTSSLVSWSVFLALNALPGAYNDHLISAFFVVIFLSWSVGRHADDRRALISLVAGTALVVAASGLDNYDDTIANVLSTTAFAVWAPVLIGRFMRHRAQLHETLRAKAAALEAERAERARAVAADERTRIAGELHDVVAHALSAMVVQAGGARRLAERNPAQAAAAFGAVESTGREALTEIRTLLGVLRREDEELALAPQPSLRHVTALVARARAAGLPTELEVDGEPRELPAGIDLTAYRVVQEALRGAAEQGAAGAARVRLRYAGDHVELRVDDDGSAPVRDLPGIRERVGFYGGALRAGARRDGGGHSVRARLPVEGPS
jgi:signal transduction histidine kinase